MSDSTAAPESVGFSTYNSYADRRVSVSQRPDPQPTAEASGKSKSASSSTSSSNGTADVFNGPLTNLQIRVPADLVASLKLLAIQQNRSMSAIAFEALTTTNNIQKAWVSTRRAG